MKREAIINLVLLGLFLFLGVASFTGLLKSKKKIERQDSLKPVPLLRSIEVKPQTAQIEIDAYGTMQSKNILEVRPEVTGVIEWVHPQFNKGGFLSKGTSLFRIETSEYEIQLKQAQAQVSLNTAQRESILQEQANFQRSLKLIEENFNLASRELLRYEQMLKEKTVSQQELDKIQIQAQNQELQVINMKNQMALIPARLAQAQSNIDLARARLQDARRKLERCEIKAPFSGKVIEKNISVGQFVNQGFSTGKLMNLETLQIEVPLPAQELDWLKPDRSDSLVQLNSLIANEEVAVQMISPTSKRLEGKVVRLASGLDMNTRTLNAFVEIQNRFLGGKPDPLLLPGAFAKISFLGQKLDNVVRIPRSAQKDSKVLLVRNGKVSTHPVKIIRDDGDELILANDFQNGDQVLKLYSELMSEGQTVKTIIEGEKARS